MNPTQNIIMTDELVDAKNPLPVKQVAGTWKEIGLNWLVNQSVSTVLLIAILGALAHGVPAYVLPAIQRGYEKNAEIQRETLKVYTESRDRELKQMMEGHDRDRAAFEKVIDRIRP